MKKHQSEGFTLLELMIAMMIFSIMSLMAYSGLANMLNSNEANKAYDQDLTALQRTMMFVERDFRQLAPRPRTEDYDQKSPALTSGLDAEGLVEFTRAGNPNPVNQLRSSLQRVRYILEDNKLSRLSWNLVDHVIGEEPVTMPLLDKVDSVSLRFLDDRNQWQENWGAGPQLALLPEAIEITIKHQKWGKIIRVVPFK